MPLPSTRPLLVRRLANSTTTSLFSASTRMFALHPPRPANAKPRTFDETRSLPRLPIPPLEQTLSTYLNSLRPFLEENNNLETGLVERRKIVADFMKEGGLGSILQERLRDIDELSPKNWLDDTIWLQKAYHEWRVPLLINSNWWLLFHNDTTIPSTFTSLNDQGDGGVLASSPSSTQSPTGLSRGAGDVQGRGMGEFTEWQVRRAAWLVGRFLDFKQRLESGDILPDTSRAGPLDMFQYTRLFNLARIPQQPHDTLSLKPSTSTVASRSITLLVRDHVYSVEVVDAESLQPLPVAEIESRLWGCVKDLLEKEGKGEEALRVGVLTSDGRDQWCENRTHLLSLNPSINRSHLTTISESLFALSLDSHTLPPFSSTSNSFASPSSPPPSQPSSSSFISTDLSSSTLASDLISEFKHDALSLSSDPAPNAPVKSERKEDGSHVVKSEVDAHVLVCAGGGPTPRNRWFDKALSVVVETSGRAGMMGEHSPCDALIPSIIVDYAIAQPIDLSAFPSVSSSSPTAALSTSGWSRLDWSTGTDPAARADLERRINEAELRGREVMADSEASQLWFGEYGAKWIKEHAKVSPDAFIQMALQLAYYRDQGKFSATYETASTRMFAHGRTEVIRTYSTDSRAFVLAMCGSGVSSAIEQYKLLEIACKSHTAFTKSSSIGTGCDRHLFGLKLMLRPASHSSSEPAESHPLFDDPLFAKSAEWKLSTSGLSSGERFRGTGFGTVWPDGYGINYLPGPNLIKFGIESKRSASNTATHAFKVRIWDALVEMRSFCEQANVSGGGEGVAMRMSASAKL